MLQKITFLLLNLVLLTTTVWGNISNELLFIGNAEISVDTIKDPTGSKLSKKKKRLEGKAVQGGSFSSSAVKRKADKLYEALGFMAAVDVYQELEGMEKSTRVTAKVANGYRLNGQTEDAEYYYSQVVKNTDNPEDILHYAQVLQSNGKCEDAVRWYKVYLSKSFDTNREFIKDCDELEAFKESHVEVSNVEALNSENLDFTLIPYKEGVIFTSNRGINKVAQRQDKWTNESFSDLFYAKKDKDGNFEKINALNGDINEKYHDGVPTFNHAGTVMIFTRNEKKKKNRNGNKDLKLCSAEGKDGYWTNVKELEINDKDYATCHPALSPDGRRLYFSSDRPGGFGGMDIYFSEKIGHTWSDPINLGATINTAGNEIFPFMGDGDDLYFSSDGHRGVGGLDIYAAKKANKTDETTWDTRENLGYPFNSKKDDFSFFINVDNKSGYFTSNRIGGKGGDDIYEWKGEINSKVVKSKALERKICVTNADTGDRIASAEVTIFKTKDGVTTEEQIVQENTNIYMTLKPLNNGGQDYVISIMEKNGSQLGSQNYYKTDEIGTFDYTPERKDTYIFMVEKDGYFTQRKTVKASEILKGKEYCFALERRNCLALEGTVKNKNFPTVIPNAEVKIFNKCNGEINVTFSDKDGKFDACLDCGCEYEIMAYKKGFSANQTVVSTMNHDCEDVELEAPIVATIELETSDNPFVANDSYPSWGYPDGNNSNGNYPNGYGTNGSYATPTAPDGRPSILMTPEQLREYFLGSSANTFEVGQVIKLTNLYYDFDEYYIRGDAARELQNLELLLKTYPSMQITLMSHTDSRGSNKYNQTLSKNRAKSVVKYLTEGGIASNRMVPVGFGESRLKNSCEDTADCSEYEHQLNRRTEVRILQINAPGTWVEYEDNLPITIDAKD
ncbi:MAG: outer membrane protein OmpA-like peptidoglycan-associated protein [Saprospiraceae bacterium]|jgi:outer membrane protein OmpA-like peptidoglycan-associated protein